MSVSSLRRELCKKSAACWPLSTQLSAYVDLTMYQHAIVVKSYRSRNVSSVSSLLPVPCPLSPSPAPSLVLFSKNKFEKERLLLRQTRSDIKGKMRAALAQAPLGLELKYIHRYGNP